MQDRFVLSIEVRSSLVFESIWIGTVEQCVYGQVTDGVDHTGDESYCQIFC